MKLKDIAIILICVVLSAALLTAAYVQLDGLNKARVRMGLTAVSSPQDMPPSLAFATVAMGAFRGLVVDILWIRADKLKQEGLFFDAKQLADWITVLQPRFASVWDFQSWNMAYNISVAIPASQPQERWRWVRNGYELLRDRGIPMNPHSILLYRQLAWIFLHKMGEIADDCHRYYKLQLAMSINPLIGPNTNEYFDRLCAAPKTLVQLAGNSDVAALIGELRSADPVFGQQDTFVDNYLSIRQSPGRFSPEAAAVLQQYKGSDALDRLDVFSCAYSLKEKWKMDVNFMAGLNHKYGPAGYNDPNQRQPLNWLHPAAHAIYWSAMGLREAGRPGQYSVDEKNDDRMIFHGLQQLYRTGKVILYTTTDGKTDVFLRPDVRMFDSCDQIWQKIIAKYQALEHGNPKGLSIGHKNFLENAAMSFYQAGHEGKAMEIFRRLGKMYPLDEYGQERTEYKGSLLEFVKREMKGEFEGLGVYDAAEAVVFTLQEGYFRYAVHDDDEASVRESIAGQIYGFYQSQTGSAEQNRMGLPPMDLLRYGAFMGFMNDPEYPQELRMSLLGRIKIEKPQLFEKLKKQESAIMEQMQKQRAAPADNGQ